MAKYCPIINEKVTYQFCEDCEEKICKENNKEKNHEENQ